MPFEHLFTYSIMQFDIVSHVLTLGFAVMLAALMYFILTIKTVAPKYRTSSVISVVVMVSAFLILYFQANSWINAFVFDPALGQYVTSGGGQLFSNGFRYLNWLIDVPMLLLQILFIVGITAAKRAKLTKRFFISGSLMIITGYIGQFYETTSMGEFAVRSWISTLFFLHVLYLIFQVIKESLKDKTLPAEARGTMKAIWRLFLVSRMIYPIAYLLPVFSQTADAAVLRQILYTVADISSKVIYGVLLMQVATAKSKAEGYILKD